MSTTRALMLLLASFGVACGSSSPKTQPEPPVATSDAGQPDADAEPPAVARTMKSNGLLAGSPQNLLIDPVFASGQAEWGHFIATFGASFSPAKFDRRLVSASPGGAAGAVAIVMDPAATDTKSKSMTMLSSFVGGPGPYAASIWASASNVAGEPREFPKDATAFRVTITAAMGGSGVSYELKRDEASARSFGTRTWYRFNATIDATLAGGGFFNVKLGTQGGGFQLVLPEIVPTALLGAGTKSLEVSAKANPIDPQELDAARAYLRIPPRLEGASPPRAAFPLR